MKKQDAPRSKPSSQPAVRTGLLSALIPGLGSLTLGHPGRGLFFLAAIFAALTGMLLAVHAATPAHKWATAGGGLALLLLVYGLNVTDAVRLARRSGPSPMTPLQRVAFAGVYVGVALLTGFTLLTSERLQRTDLYRIHSTSMSPSLLHGDYILVDLKSDCVDCEAALCRGDIVVFTTEDSTMVKRIVGLPGDRVQISDQTLRVNSDRATGATLKSLDNPELQHFHRSSTARTESLGPHEYVTVWDKPDPDSNLEVEVPPAHVFVLGDNRHHAKDSRTLGSIPIRQIQGRVDQAWLSRERRSEVEPPLFGPPLSFGSCANSLAESVEIAQPRSTPAPPSLPNLLLITIDTLRADHLGAYGHAGATTPTLDGLAGLGIRFDQAFTPFPRTTPALASLFTGLLPAHHGSRDVGQPIEHGERLAEVLAAAGYQTRAVSGTALAGVQQGFSHGFDTFVGLRDEDPPLTATEVTRRALEAMADVDPEKPAFLWVHYFDPHFPYRPPPGFPNQPLARECRDLTQKTLVQPRIQWSLHANWGGLAEAALSDCLELYDAEIHYTDTEIAQLLYGLGRLDFLDSVVIAITADHGESFGESGTYYEHGATVHDSAVRIPLILVGPDIDARVESGLFSLEDLMPTLLGLLEVPPASRPSMDGTDFSERIQNKRVIAAASRLLYAESANTNKPPAFALPFQPNRMQEACRFTATQDDCSRFGGVGELLTAMRNVNTVTHELPQSPTLTRATQRIQERFKAGEARQRSVRDGDFKLVQAPRANGGFQRSLFNLRLDPLETRDASQDHPEQRAELDSQLDAWLREIPEATRHSPSPQQTELLKNLGYLE